MSKTVAILGCGPSALFAAHAATMADHEVIIFSRKRKSEMYGAQFLHMPIPEVSEDPFTIEYSLMGTADGYRDKVYGPGYRGTVSVEEFSGEYPAWDIRYAYNYLWFRYASNIVDITFTNAIHIANTLDESGANIFLSTIPAPLLCNRSDHGFTARSVWAVGDAPERGVFSPITTELNQVVCSGNRDDSWYRKSNILGFNTVEWPDNRKPPIEGISPVLKPTSTNCDCFPNVHRAGRYGQWKKGVLSHSSFYDTFQGLTGRVYEA